MSAVVVKLGGHALGGPDQISRALDAVADDLADLRAAGRPVVLVHGAGPHITSMLADLGVSSRFVDGLRVTDEVTLGVVTMCLAQVNALVVAGLTARGVPAAGLAGPDEGFLVARVGDDRLGLVGEIDKVNGALLAERLERGVPVVNPIATDGRGGLLNCNADAVAGAVAAAIGAQALVLLSDVDQLRRDPEDPTTAIGSVTEAEVLDLVAAGRIREGMIPKVGAALAALSAGARRVVITDGRRRHALSEALGGRGLFTEVTR